MIDKNKLKKVKEAILTSSSDTSLQDIIDVDSKAFQGVRMLYSTDASGALLQVNNPSQKFLTGIFSKDRMLAYSDSILEEMGKGTSVIGYAQRALMDTNFVSSLQQYFSGEDDSCSDKISETLKIIEEEYGGGFDYCFSMLENMREYIKPNNPYPVNKIAAAMHFDHLVRGVPKVSKHSNNILEPYFPEAENLWMQFRSSEYMWHIVDRRDVCYAIMLKTYYLYWSSSDTSIEAIMNKLIDYCLNVLGVVPLKELYFSWKAVVGLKANEYTPVFNEKSLKKPNKNSLNRISALAWDLYVFRFIETLLTEGEGNVFYIPLVTTLDKALLDTIASCPLRAMISFPDMGYVETIFDDELLFQQCFNEALTPEQEEKLRHPERRHKGKKRLKHYMSISISDLEKGISMLY